MRPWSALPHALAALAASFLGCQSAGWLRDAPAVSQEATTQRGQSIGSQLVLDGDIALPPDHRLIQDLVAQRQIINQRLRLPETDRPIYVHLLADEDSYHRHLSRRLPKFPARRALFVETSDSLDVYAQWGDQVGVDLRHEVAHGYLHAAVPNLPLWLDEGLAEYFEVARGQGGVNLPHVELLRGQVNVAGWKPDMSRLDALTDIDQMTQLDYAEAWLWVHFLLHSQGERSELIQDYLADLREGRAPEPLSQRLRKLLAHPAPAVLEHLEHLSLEGANRLVSVEPKRREAEN